MPAFTTVSVAGGAFRIRLWEDGAGQPLLYLHSFDGHPGDAPFLADLAQDRRVLAPEHPGFGESTGIERIDDVIDMALYYRQLVETLGLEQVDVAGHSLGGMFAAEFAALCPQLVRRLILVTPFGLWLEDAQIPDLFVMTPGQLRRTLWHDPESPAAQAAPAQAGVGPAATISAVVTRATDLSTAGKFLWPIPERGLEKRLPLIKAATLILMGDSDRLIVSAYGEAFAARIPNARLQIIPEAGHLPMVEQPRAFGEAVRDFLDA